MGEFSKRGIVKHEKNKVCVKRLQRQQEKENGFKCDKCGEESSPLLP